MWLFSIDFKTKQMKLTLLFLAILIFFQLPLTAQQNTPPDIPFCATPAFKDERLTYYQQNLQNYRFLTDDTLFIPIKLHILGNNEGLGYPNMQNVLRAFCILNENFEQAKIQFYLAGDINYINNTAWHDHETFGPGSQMMQQNNVPWALNSYVVKTAAGACGYYSPGVDGVVLASNCLGPVNHTWAHEIGHQLTLPHTFFGWEGTPYNNGEAAPERLWFRGRWVQVERADGSNCRHAADGFCDTPADYVSSRWNCSASNPMGPTLIDPIGETFQVDGANIMSYSSGTCRGTFSAEQIQAMRMNLLLDRSQIIDFDTRFEPVPSEIEFIGPEQNAEVPYDNASISWRSVPNATEYRVQLTNLPFFNNLVINEVIQDTIFQLPILEIGRNYSVRVQALSNYQTCNEYSEILSFTASDLSSVLYSGEAGGEFIYENPVRIGRDLNIHYRNGMQSTDAVQISIFDIRGKFVGSFSGNVHPSDQIQLGTSDLAAGIYLLSFQFKNSNPQTRKLVISN